MDITARNTSNPFFILLNFDNLKLPLDPEERFEEMYPYQSDPVRRRYLAAVSNLDDAVGRIMATIRRYHYTEAGAERNLFEDTVIVFTSTSGGLSSPLGPVYSGSSSGWVQRHRDICGYWLLIFVGSCEASTATCWRPGCGCRPS